MLTSSATFREFTNAGGDGDYETAVPSDEYRKLTKTVGGWEAHDLDGRVKHFDAMGRWTESVDRNGNATVATYVADQLTEVSFPDQRKEMFTYEPGGKLETITEVGIDGTTTRTWTYTWDGDDLRTIERPDATAWEMHYDEPAHPGYMTRLTLIGTDLSERIEAPGSTTPRATSCAPGVVPRTSPTRRRSTPAGLAPDPPRRAHGGRSPSADR